MRKLYYRYEMKMHYDPAVREHLMNLRCVPMVNASQQIYGSRVAIEGADYITRKTDREGNTVVSCKISEPHSCFFLVSEGIAFVDVNTFEAEKRNPCYEFFTDYTRPDEKMCTFFQEICESAWDENRNVWSNVSEMMHQVYSHMSYVSGVTNVRTTAAQAFELKQGVCQDYAHILLTFCRMKGIPARYVSGFLNGEGATHAWIEVYDNGFWYGFDPTHDRTVTDFYIKVAHGRDANDCPMERGVFLGITSQTHEVKVTVKDHDAELCAPSKGEQYK